MLSIDNLCSIDQFFLLVQKFFITYSHFDWSTQSLRLHASSHCHSNESCLPSNRGSMCILCPSPPFQNSARSTTTSTRQLIVEAFQSVLPLLKQRISHSDCLETVLQLPTQFPHQSIQSVLQLKLSSPSLNELDQWIGWMKSRLARFLTACEDECQLFVQTQAALDSSGNDLERFFSMGFQIDAHILSRQRSFYHSLHEFLDQCKHCPYRTQTMTMSYQLLSINNWHAQRQEQGRASL